MKYTVAWRPIAHQQLARIWNQAQDQKQVTAASDALDDELLFDAETKGKPLGKFRMLTLPPLAVLYHVSPDDCLVTVVQVRRI